MIRFHKPGRKYCKRCWRDDYHVPIRVHPATKVLLFFLTLGISLFIWPCRCTTCGYSGYKTWVKWREYLPSNSRELR